MALALVLQMVMRGLDYMIVGMGVAALESEGMQSEEWLQSAIEMQRMVFALHFTSSVAGYVGIAIMALGLAFRPEPVRMSPVFHGIVAILAVASLAVFISAWHSNSLELAFAPVFAAMSLAGLVYMVLLGWGLASSQGNSASEPETGIPECGRIHIGSAIHLRVGWTQFPDSMRFQHNRIGNDSQLDKRFENGSH